MNPFLCHSIILISHCLKIVRFLRDPDTDVSFLYSDDEDKNPLNDTEIQQLLL